MTKVKLQCISKYQPNVTIEVDESQVSGLLARGDYILDGSEVPNEQWTEKRIKAWIETKGLPIKYDISNDKKADILSKIRG